MGMISEQTEINRLFILNLYHHIMSMGTYERTNCDSVCRPCIKGDRNPQPNTKEELVMLFKKWVSQTERLEICTLICGSCN
jgi:hypothetical protein